MRRVSSLFRPPSKRSLKSQFPTPLQLHSEARESPYATLPRKQGAAPPPSAFAMYSMGQGGHSGVSSMESFDESLEDIRRPSGLGRAASMSSKRSLPLTPSRMVFPQSSTAESQEDQGLLQEQHDGGYIRSRAKSSPNPSVGLFRSISLKAKNRLRSRRNSVSNEPEPAPAPTAPSVDPELPPPVPPLSLHHRLPVEVIASIFIHLPKSEVPGLARLSRVWSEAARIHLYTRLDLGQLKPKQIEKLLGILAPRRDLTDVVQHFTCTTWPNFFEAHRPSSATLASPSSPDREAQLRNTLLTATFTLTLQRMSNLTHLTLPSFDLSLLSQHSAFGLKSITFLNTAFSQEEMTSLFNWLDGQINISLLSFPNLEDYYPNGEDGPPAMNGDATSNPNTPAVSRLSDTPTYYLNTPVVNAAPLTPTTPSNHLTVSTAPWNGSPSPRAGSFRLGQPQAAASSLSLFLPPGTSFSSLTLLPLLSTLHATPAFLSALVPTTPAGAVPLAGRSVLCRPHLRAVVLNISTNLYDGLRPSAVMTCLKGIDELSIRFTECVDRRTVEKVLAAVSSVLGSIASEAGSDEDCRDSVEDEWLGLSSLCINFKATTPLSKGMEDTVYRALQASLSRYSRLSRLELGFTPNQRVPKSTSSPLAPLDTKTANQSTKPPQPIIVTSEPEVPNGLPSIATSRSSGSLASDMTDDILHEATNAFPLPPPSPSVFALPRGSVYNKRISELGFLNGNRISKFFVEEDSREETRPSKLTPQEQSKVDLWVKQCPSLRTVSLAGTVWHNPARPSSSRNSKTASSSGSS
ncbi:hypothetical protein BKA70DRAFT_1112752 [Coprinopsis sp. MPI-PUGE-AT-0042]|nr:hypothetical protein BKA70DRAFT_1112752 [Coprinopsis sp. MPI-PUGE-AT-0042]